MPFASFSAVAAFTSLFFFNLFQLLSFVVLPFSRDLFRRVNSSCAGLWWGLSLKWSDKFLGSRIMVVGDALPMGENAVVFANHQQMPDVLCIWKVARGSHMLRHLKWFAKSSLKWVPGMGWGMWCIDSIFLKRDWEADRGKVVSYLGKFEREKIPIWLVSFPEGTRLTPEKRQASQSFARKRGRPVLQNVLLPRTKGFTTSVEGLREHCDAVYMVTIYYVHGVSSLWRWLRGLGGDVVVDVVRFPMNEVPQGDRDLGPWLISRFEAMDRKLTSLAAAHPPSHS